MDIPGIGYAPAVPLNATLAGTAGLAAIGIVKGTSAAGALGTATSVPMEMGGW